MLKFLFIVMAFSEIPTGGAPPADETATIAKPSSCRPSWGSGQSCNVDFEGDDVYAEQIGPEGDTVLARRGPRFGSLIRYRTDFDDRIEETAAFID